MATFFHGSNHKITKFSDEFVGQGHDQEGPGIYLTTSAEDAERYGKYLYRVEFNPRKLVSTKPGRPTNKEINFLIKNAPDYEETLYNWGENPKLAYLSAMQSMIDSGENPHQIFQSIWYDFYRYSPVEYVRNMVKLGYDGVIIKKTGVDHAIVFNPESITSFNIINDNLSESYVKRLKELAGINEQKDLSSTKVVDSNGEPLIVWRSQNDEKKQGSERQSKTFGIYFSADKDSTKIYGSITKPYYLNIKKPLILKDKAWNLSIIPEYLYKDLISKGYDGAIWLRNGKMYEIVAFYPEQVFPVEKELSESDRKLGKKLSDIKGKGFVTVYRAVGPSVTTFKEKDYVTLSKKFAVEHAESNAVYFEEQQQVIQTIISTENLYEAYNPGEYFYSGPEKKAKVIYLTKGEDYEGYEELKPEDFIS